MSLITLLPRNRPKIDTITFDAVLEETLEIESEVTQYTIEGGARAADHRVFKPIKWRIMGGVSNNPLRVQATDFTGVVSRITNDPVANLALGAAAGLLTGPSETAAADFIQEVIQKGFNAPAFDVITDDAVLHDMTFVSFRRTNDTETEGALIFEAELQELPTLDRIRRTNGSVVGSVTSPVPNDPSAVSISNTVNLGQRSLRRAGATVNNAVNQALEYIDPDFFRQLMEIPLTPNIGHQVFSVRLGEVQVRFELNYIQTGQWCCNLFSGDQVLVKGVMLEYGADIIEHYNLRIGRLIFVGEDTTLENLGIDNHLIWVAP